MSNRIIFLDFDGVLNTEHYQNFLYHEGKPWQDEHGAFFDPEAIEQLRHIIDAITADIVLDSNDVTSGMLYYATKGLHRPVVDMMPGEVLKTVDNFYDEMRREGHMTDREIREQRTYNVKKVSDMFHPWSLLKGRLNHQLGNLGEMKGEVTAMDIAKVATWAERTVVFSPYVGTELETWVKDKAKTMHVKMKDVAAARETLSGKQVHEPRKRPELSKAARESAAKRFSHSL